MREGWGSEKKVERGSWEWMRVGNGGGGVEECRKGGGLDE